ncbi:hypothetical protein AAFF_G00314180 [Aldrovandia affinis]|uniref:Growth/differentiation factor 8 n=1 Tax=Aldrovandia affinis TaxID=143900 RepID=A0AAD7R820_9TELE|nr:hypothetical protein AAFF_G00314180 [Aldrovandia affinis]
MTAKRVPGGLTHELRSVAQQREQRERLPASERHRDREHASAAGRGVPGCVGRVRRGGSGDIGAHKPPAAAGDSEQCSTCDFRQHSKFMRLHAIKSQILSKLRLKQAPNISRDVVQQLLPKAPPLQRLLDQYDVLADDNKDGPVEEDDDHATTETIMAMGTEPDPIVQLDQNPRCCLFSFSPKIQSGRIVKAQLWVHLRPAGEATTVFLQISRLKPAADGTRHTRIRSLKIDVNAGSSSWQSIDVKQVLLVWLRQPETNWGLEINAFDTRGNDLVVTSAEPGEEGLQPFMEVKISDTPGGPGETRVWTVRRARRSPGAAEVPPHPPGEQGQPPGNSGPCCTPTKMSPINMLYFNRREQIIYGKIPSMVVDRCGCS